MFHHQTIPFNASTGASMYRSADLFSTTLGGLRLCVGCLHIRVSSHPEGKRARGGGGGELGLWCNCQQLSNVHDKVGCTCQQFSPLQ